MQGANSTIVPWSHRPGKTAAVSLHNSVSGERGIWREKKSTWVATPHTQHLKIRRDGIDRSSPEEDSQSVPVTRHDDRRAAALAPVQTNSTSFPSASGRDTTRIHPQTLLPSREFRVFRPKLSKELPHLRNISVHVLRGAYQGSEPDHSSSIVKVHKVHGNLCPLRNVIKPSLPRLDFLSRTFRRNSQDPCVTLLEPNHHLVDHPVGGGAVNGDPAE